MNNAELSQQGRWKVIRPSLVYRSEAEDKGGREQAETFGRGSWTSQATKVEREKPSREQAESFVRVRIG